MLLRSFTQRRSLASVSMRIHIHPYTQEQVKQFKKKSKCVYIPLLAAGSLCWSKGRLFSFFPFPSPPRPFPTPLPLFGFLVLEIGSLYTARAGLELQTGCLHLSSANITEGCYYVSFSISLLLSAVRICSSSWCLFGRYLAARRITGSLWKTFGGSVRTPPFMLRR